MSAASPLMAAGQPGAAPTGGEVSGGGASGGGYVDAAPTGYVPEALEQALAEHAQQGQALQDALIEANRAGIASGVGTASGGGGVGASVQEQIAAARERAGTAGATSAGSAPLGIEGTALEANLAATAPAGDTALGRKMEAAQARKDSGDAGSAGVERRHKGTAGVEKPKDRIDENWGQMAEAPLPGDYTSTRATGGTVGAQGGYIDGNWSQMLDAPVPSDYSSSRGTGGAIGGVRAPDVAALGQLPAAAYSEVDLDANGAPGDTAASNFMYRPSADAGAVGDARSDFRQDQDETYGGARPLATTGLYTGGASTQAAPYTGGAEIETIIDGLEVENGTKFTANERAVLRQEAGKILAEQGGTGQA